MVTAIKTYKKNINLSLIVCKRHLNNFEIVGLSLDIETLEVIHKKKIDALILCKFISRRSTIISINKQCCSLAKHVVLQKYFIDNSFTWKSLENIYHQETTYFFNIWIMAIVEDAATDSKGIQ